MNPIKLPRNNKYLPKDTVTLLPSVLNESELKDFNFSYLFNLPKISEEKRGEIKIHLNEGIENYKWDKEWLKHINGRVSYFIKQFKKDGFSTTRSFRTTLAWRMVIGLGASHPQETSMTLHHTYGIPYIPGSAIKGVTRHWVIWEKFGGDEEKASKNEDFKNIFGAQDQSGKIVFFDAYPAGEINLKVDVMTPHYPDYYSKGVEPADWQSPNPVKFLTVEKTGFQFYLASRKENENLLEKTLGWLKESLTHFGIGAKTSAGYGYFEVE